MVPGRVEGGRVMASLQARHSRRCVLGSVTDPADVATETYGHWSKEAAKQEARAMEGAFGI
jgi:hypothetical protein